MTKNIQFKSKQERDAWLQKASNDDVIQYLEKYKPHLLKKARQTMSDTETVNWCKFMSDYTIANQDVDFRSK